MTCATVTNMAAREKASLWSGMRGCAPSGLSAGRGHARDPAQPCPHAMSGRPRGTARAGVEAHWLRAVTQVALCRGPCWPRPVGAARAAARQARHGNSSSRSPTHQPAPLQGHAGRSGASGHTHAIQRHQPFAGLGLLSAVGSGPTVRVLAVRARLQAGGSHPPTADGLEKAVRRREHLLRLLARRAPGERAAVAGLLSG